ncbi:UPF0158 family protein [Dysgonomonas sp.]
MDYPQEVIRNIAQEIDMGMICYLNTDTMELDSVFGSSYDAYGSGDYDDMYKQVYDKVNSWQHSICIEPLESWESFEIMERFIEEVIPENNGLKDTLVRAMSQRHPFRNFKFHIDNSPYRQDWFDFKQQQLEIHVRNLLEANSQE